MLIRLLEMSVSVYLVYAVITKIIIPAFAYRALNRKVNSQVELAEALSKKDYVQTEKQTLEVEKQTSEIEKEIHND